METWAMRKIRIGLQNSNDSFRLTTAQFCLDLNTSRSWRNWQTRQLEVLVLVRDWRFKSSRPHSFFFGAILRPSVLLSGQIAAGSPPSILFAAVRPLSARQPPFP